MVIIGGANRIVTNLYHKRPPNKRTFFTSNTVPINYNIKEAQLPMTNFEILQLAVYHAGFKINSVEDLADLQQKLEENYLKVKEANVYEELQEFVVD